MSLGDEERSAMVTLEIERAKSLMGEMDYLQQGKLWNNMAVRLYYALFHAVCALMIHDGHKVGTHKGSHILFSQLYVKTGILPVKYSELYKQMEIIRNNGDYNCYYDVKPEELLDRMPLAKEMIDTIAEMVEEGKRSPGGAKGPQAGNSFPETITNNEK